MPQPGAAARLRPRLRLWPWLLAAGCCWSLAGCQAPAPAPAAGCQAPAPAEAAAGGGGGRRGPFGTPPSPVHTIPAGFGGLPSLTAAGFYTEFVRGSVPVVFRGLGPRHFAAALGWTDAALTRQFGGQPVKWEQGKEEDRRNVGGELPLARFAERYKTDDIYAVWDLEEGDGMLRGLALPNFLSCAGFEYCLTKTSLWYSAGGTSSAFHSDGLDNFHCVLDGSKTFGLVNKTHQDWVEASGDFGWARDGDASTVLMDHVDHAAFPGFRDVEHSSATLQAGDCLFLPTGWYHHVRTPKGHRSLSFNVWLHHLQPDDFELHAPACGGGGPSAGLPRPLTEHAFFDEQQLTVEDNALVGPGAGGWGAFASAVAGLLAAPRWRRGVDYAGFGRILSSSLASRRTKQGVFDGLDRNGDGVLGLDELEFSEFYTDAGDDAELEAAARVDDGLLERVEAWKESVAKVARLAYLERQLGRPQATRGATRGAGAANQARGNVDE